MPDNPAQLAVAIVLGWIVGFLAVMLYIAHRTRGDLD